jgi:hypothetical protein
MAGMKFEMESPKTQTLEAVEALATYLNKPIEAGVLDLGAVKLVLSNKKDCYYVVTSRSCSCPSATYRPGQPCKHQRKHFGLKPAVEPITTDSIKPAGKWAGGHNGPVPIEMI